MSRVLVVDDEPPILRALTANLRARGFEPAAARDGEEALRVAAEFHPDVVVLDLGLPGISGLEVIRGLRGWTSVPIIILSARDAERDKVAALDAGADDYVTKPFGMDELFARVRAAAPPGEQCRAFVALCRELWDLEGRHGFEPPRVIHWRHELEVGFRKGPLRLELRLEDHEHAGVAEPLTVPTLTLHDDEAGLALPLALAEERLDPAHHATRPVAPAHAMRLERLRPFLEHTAAFFAAHPELLEDRRGLRELVTARDG